MTSKESDKQTFGPYEPVRQAGDWWFVSGQVGVDPVSKQTGETVATQMHQALRNLAKVLGGVGLEMRDVVKTTVYVTDMADFGAVNEVYVGYFAAPRPARAMVGVKELPRVGGATAIRVEIEAVAWKGGAR